MKRQEESNLRGTLTDDCLSHIFSFLDLPSLREASRTCKSWHRAVSLTPAQPRKEFGILRMQDLHQLEDMLERASPVFHRHIVPCLSLGIDPKNIDRELNMDLDAPVLGRFKYYITTASHRSQFMERLKQPVPAPSIQHAIEFVHLFGIPIDNENMVRSLSFVPRVMIDNCHVHVPDLLAMRNKTQHLILHQLRTREIGFRVLIPSFPVLEFGSPEFQLTGVDIAPLLEWNVNHPHDVPMQRLQPVQEYLRLWFSVLHPENAFHGLQCKMLVLISWQPATATLTDCVHLDKLLCQDVTVTMTRCSVKTLVLRASWVENWTELQQLETLILDHTDPRTDWTEPLKIQHMPNLQRLDLSLNRTCPVQVSHNPRLDYLAICIGMQLIESDNPKLGFITVLISEAPKQDIPRYQLHVDSWLDCVFAQPSDPSHPSFECYGYDSFFYRLPSLRAHYRDVTPF